MLKTRKKWISLLVAVVMVAALLVPFVGTASATAAYSVTSVPSVPAGATNQTTTVVVSFDPATAEAAAGALFLTLPASPSGFQFDAVGGIPVTPSSNTLEGSANIDALGLISPTYSTVPVKVYSTNEAYMVELIVPTITSTMIASGATQVQLSFPLTFNVAAGVTGNISLQASSQNSVYPSGSVVIATVGTSSLNLAVETTPSIGGDSVLPTLTVSGTNLPGLIDVTENAVGSAYASSGAFLKLTLPPGIYWNQSTPFALTYMWGDTGVTAAGAAFNGLLSSSSGLNTYLGEGTVSHPGVGWALTNDSRELDFYNDAVNTAIDNGGAPSSALFFKLQPYVTVDSSIAQTGNITVTVGGLTSSNVSSGVIGSYGTYGAIIGGQTKTTIYAGQADETLADLEIKENIAGSIIGPREIDLTLPSEVAWMGDGLPQVDTNLSTNYGNLNSSLSNWEAVGSTGNEIKCEILSNASTQTQNTGADVFLKNLKVITSSDFTGNIAVIVSGTEGLTGNFTLATAVAPVSVTASATPNIQIGLSGQTVGNLTITEPAAGIIRGDETYTALDETALSSTDNLVVSYASATEAKVHVKTSAPFVTFDTTPTVTVTAGNLVLDTGNVTTGTDSTNYGYLDIPIKSSSTTASTISITGIVLTADRSVPQGPLSLKVDGSAIDDAYYGVGSPNYYISPDATLFPNGGPVAKVEIANVATPAPGGASGTAVFKIGSTSYTLNGATMNIDVAPYIKDSRTFLPLRFVSNALGVADSNIMWDAASQKVTIIKGSMVVQLTIGSTTMLMNGAAITMDTAPEITSGRTCLPIAWVAEALTAQIAWDATAQTVTITF